jgi:hypothetical protein
MPRLNPSQLCKGLYVFGFSFPHGQVASDALAGQGALEAILSPSRGIHWLRRRNPSAQRLKLVRVFFFKCELRLSGGENMPWGDSRRDLALGEYGRNGGY